MIRKKSLTNKDKDEYEKLCDRWKEGFTIKGKGDTENTYFVENGTKIQKINIRDIKKFVELPEWLKDKIEPLVEESDEISNESEGEIENEPNIQIDRMFIEEDNEHRETNLQSKELQGNRLEPQREEIEQPRAPNLNKTLRPKQWKPIVGSRVEVEFNHEKKKKWFCGKVTEVFKSSYYIEFDDGKDNGYYPLKDLRRCEHNKRDKYNDKVLLVKETSKRQPRRKRNRHGVKEMNEINQPRFGRLEGRPFIGRASFTNERQDSNVCVAGPTQTGQYSDTSVAEPINGLGIIGTTIYPRVFTDLGEVSIISPTFTPRVLCWPQELPRSGRLRIEITHLVEGEDNKKQS